MSTPSSDADLPTETEREPAPDMLAELGPLAYGLFVLSQPGPLSEVRSLTESRGAQVPAQVERTVEAEHRQDALLDELGNLDI